MSDSQQPATRAITAGRAHSRTSLAPALWASTTWESEGLRDANRRATGDAGRRVLQPLLQPDRALVRGGHRRARRRRGRAGVRVGHGRHRHGDLRPVLDRRPHRRPAPAVRRHARVPAGPVPADGHRGHAGRRHRARRVRRRALRPGRTMLALAETPSNPRLELVDLDELGALRGPITVVDSTFATPLGQQPLAHGVHLSLHSATKGIAGLNDATLGVIAGERELIDAIWAYSVLHGSTPSPYDALNAIRGIRTLAVRTAHQAASALHIAEALADEPAVAAVHYPGSRLASAVRSRQAPDAQRWHGAGDRAGRRPRRLPSTSSIRCSSPASPRRSAARRRWSAIRRRRPTPASRRTRQQRWASATVCCESRSVSKTRPTW